MEYLCLIFVIPPVIGLSVLMYKLRASSAAKHVYLEALERLKHDPQNPELREQTLVAGRTYARIPVSNFDEAMLINDINAACARDVSRPDIVGPRLMAFLFTDLVDSTGMKQRMGDSVYVRAVLKPHNKLFHDAVGKFPTAVERDNAGDGFFATFDSLTEAVEFALLFQYGMYTFVWECERPQTRVGIHLGDAIQIQEMVGPQKSVGQAQDLAARLMGLASGGQILLSRAVSDGARQYVRKHPVADQGTELAWVRHGAYQLKGREEPIEVFEVGVIGRAPLQAPADSEKAWRVVKTTTVNTSGGKQAEA
ncbi:MAG: adenylate/guanylate cyclase domain-containing protein [Gemmataceae bacterium]